MDNVKISVTIVLPGSVSKIVIDKQGNEHEFNKYAPKILTMNIFRRCMRSARLKKDVFTFSMIGIYLYRA